MKAAVIHTFGEPPRFGDFSEPVLSSDTVKVKVLAAGLHPIVKALASASHYGSSGVLPMIPGIDGIGLLEDGTRVYFGMTQPPYGTMAEWAVVPREMRIPVPESLDDATAAALFNPGLSAWLSLRWKAQLAPGETVLVLGATGAAGKLAVQMAKLFGAGKVIAAGRNKMVLSKLHDLGADATIHLDLSDQEIADAIAREAGSTGIHVILDYLWGHPTEVTIAAITRKGLTHLAPRVRLIEIGQMAGSTITLPAAVLRSSGLEIYGNGAGTVSIVRVMEEMPKFMEYAASNKFSIDVEAVPLSDVESAWLRQPENNSRLVFIP